MRQPSSSTPARLLRASAALLLGTLLAAFACSEPQSQDITGETHFLTRCDAASAACGSGLVCLCGVCTRACDATDDCSAFASAECVAATSPAACGESQQVNRCDVSCSTSADCAVVSGAHRCDLGFCRAGSGSGGLGGAGGAGGGNSLGGGGGGGDAGSSGGTGECERGEVTGNQVVVLGDTFMALTHQITAGVEELARAGGSLPAGQRYRDESTILNNALALNGNGIEGQYARAVEEGSVSVVIMNGGGADVLNGSCDDPPTPECPVLAAATEAARELFARMATDGVAHVVYAFYPDPVDVTVREKMDVLRPQLEAVCEQSPAPCHWLDLRAVFEGRYAEYIAPDGLNPTAAGSLAAADAIWRTMQEYCVAQ